MTEKKINLVNLVEVTVSSVLKRQSKFWDVRIEVEEIYQDKEKMNKAGQE